MKTRVLGCYGSELSDFHTTSFLINGSVLLDAGTVTSALTLDEQMKIHNVLLTHCHLDHTKDILFLADNVVGKNTTAIEVISIPPVIESLRFHLLNDRIWPNFATLPTIEEPVLQFRSIRIGETILVDGLTVRAISVNHTVEAVGYIIGDGKSSILYTGDTGPSENIWEEANKLPDLKAVIVETSFPNHLHRLAEVSGHLTPLMLRDQLNKLKSSDLPILVFHMKPQHLRQLKKEIKELKNPNIIVLEQGEEFEF